MHDSDIRGEPWRPCAACPHPTPGQCPSRRHRPYCDRVASRPEVWGPIVAGLPPEDRPGVARQSRPTPTPEPPLPSARRMAGQLLSTAGAVVSHAITTGEVRADAEMIARRLAICGECDHLTADRRCGQIDGCGCWVDAKAAYIAARCPIGRW